MLELTRNGKMDALTVKIEPREGVEEADAAAAAKALQQCIKTRIGTSVGVELVPAESLERSQGKLKRLYDLR